MKRPMAHIQIIGLKPQLMPTIRALHHLGCVQIEDVADVDAVSAPPLTLSPDMVRRRENVTHVAARLEGLLAELGNGERETAVSPTHLPPPDACLTQAETGLAELGPQVHALVDRRQQLQAEQTSLPRYEATLRRLLPIVPPEAQEPENATVSILVGRAHRWVLDAVTEEVLRETGGRAQVAAGKLDDATEAMILVVPRQTLPDVETLLGREDISRLQLPDAIAGQPPDQAVVALSQRLAAIPDELDQIQAELDRLDAAWRERLRGWLICLQDELDQINVLSRLGETEHTFVLAGWLPQQETAVLRQTLHEQIGDGVVVEPLPLTPADEARAPVMLDNTAAARPFESLVRLYRLPDFWDIDPTLLMAFFMPMFFGMILGDIGYGAVLFLLCLLGLRRFRQPGVIRDVLKILAYGALWSILFGFLYGELFGTLGEEIGLHPILFDRADAAAVTTLLLFTLVVGAVHITLGLILGLWVAVQERSRHLLLERGGTLLGLAGLFLLISALAEWLPSGFRNPGILIMILGIVLLSAAHGWVGILLGPIEFVGVLGNILSYLRIAAVGLASVYVARLANDLAGVVGVAVIGVIIALLIHALNLVLGAFSPTIHSMRLHYVEFFRKFYEGGGQPFHPFRSRLTG